MRLHFSTLTASLIPILLVQILFGCIPVSVRHSVPAETEDIEIHEDQFKRIVVAPYFHRAEVNEFTEALFAADKDIEAVEVDTVFQQAFPDRESIIEVSVSELLQPDVRDRILASGVRFFVVLSPYQTTATEGDGSFYVVYLHTTSRVTTNLMAGLIDLNNPAIPEYIETEAQGKVSVNWIGPYLGLFIFGSEPETEESAMDGMAQRIVAEIRQKVPEQKLKIMVIAGDWDAAKESYEIERAQQELQDKARQGDSEAQWQLYSEAPGVTNLIWLCRSADHGNTSARNELGNLYHFGSKEYHGFDGVKQSISEACMWFHLAGSSQLADYTEPAQVVQPQKVDDTAEMERTHISMSVDERHAAKYLVAGWHPGQCRADALKTPENVHSNQDKMLALCKKADLGDVAARNELGYLYFFGFEGFPEDPSKSYMWYYLASSAAGSSSDKQSMQQVCDTMTKKEHEMAVRALKNWKPGQCAAEFGLAADKAPSL